MQDTTTPQPTTPPTPPGVTPPPKKNIQQIISMVFGAVCVIAIGAYLVSSLLPGNDQKAADSKNTASQQDSDEKLRQANAVTATSLSNLNAPCQVGSVTNAAEFTKPYKVAAFSKTTSARSWTNVSLDSKADYSVKYNEYEKVSVVACVKEKEGAAVKSSTCDFKSGDKTTSLDYYATKYEVSVYEAKSGKKIKDLGEVSAPAPASRCPIFTMYNKSDPKLIAAPDSNALNALVAAFVAE